MANGWNRSAQVWINLMGSEGDFSRKHVLDRPMMDRVRASGADTVLDVGCGEGRFCRMMAPIVPGVTGLDPTVALLEIARQGPGTYVQAIAEDMPFEDASFDLIVSYLTLIDIADARAGLAEMHRVLRPGGRLLIGNLNSWITASHIKSDGWSRGVDGAATMTINRYLEEYANWFEWSGMRIQNWHRPLVFYMQALLELGFQMCHFDEPAASEESDQTYNAAPYLYLMEWKKPE